MMEFDMNARIIFFVAATVVASLAVVGLTVGVSSGHAPSTPGSGDFAARFQPTLDGIGSTRDLKPVPLGDAPPTTSLQPRDSAAAKAKHHERAAHP
jgi:hypothetical protein